MTSGVNDIGVLIRSYDGDAKWLAYTLPRLLQRATGYNDLVVTGIPSQCEQVARICAEHGVEFKPDEESAKIPNGYLNQQYTKMRAHLFLENDYIAHVDSDILALEGADFNNLMDGDKAVILWDAWEDVGDAQCWRNCTAYALGQDPKFEFMRRLPLVYHRDTQRDCCAFIEQTHNESLLEHIARGSRFSEFNVLGAYAWRFERDKYKWVQGKWDNTVTGFKWFWSHGNMEEQINAM